MKINSNIAIQILFHLIFWGAWFGLPFINSADNEGFRKVVIATLPISISFIPLFFINTRYLIRILLPRRGTSAYVLSLIILLALFTLGHYFVRPLFLEPGMGRHHSIIRSMIPVLFIVAMSTAYGFIIYLNEQNKAIQEEQAERLKSELSFLRSQISPHFIFNILNSIVYLIRSKSELAETVTIKLSEIMRYMLYIAGNGHMPLEKELKYLDNFIELQRIRFGNDVDIQFHLEGNSKHLEIEPMLIIPFVENAFKHGVGMIQDPTIMVDIKIQDQKLLLTVKNKINPTDEDKDPDSGIGLRNVNRRLELLYPDQHELSVNSEEDWFIVNLSLQLAKENS